MKKFSVLFVILASFLSVNAQKIDGSVKGKLMDTTAKKPVPDATITLINAKDSSIVSYMVSDKLGAFEIKNIDAGDYTVVVYNN